MNPVLLSFGIFCLFIIIITIIICIIWLFTKDNEDDSETNDDVNVSESTSTSTSTSTSKSMGQITSPIVYNFYQMFFSKPTGFSNMNPNDVITVVLYERLFFEKIRKNMLWSEINSSTGIFSLNLEEGRNFMTANYKLVFENVETEPIETYFTLNLTRVLGRFGNIPQENATTTGIIVPRIYEHSMLNNDEFVKVRIIFIDDIDIEEVYSEQVKFRDVKDGNFIINGNFTIGTYYFIQIIRSNTTGEMIDTDSFTVINGQVTIGNINTYSNRFS